MSINLFGPFAAVLLFCGACAADGINDVKTISTDTAATLENTHVRVTFDLKKGTYTTYDLATGTEAVAQAYARVNGYNSLDPEITRVDYYPAEDPAGKGATLEITTSHPGEPEIVLAFTLYRDADYLILDGGINNTLDSIIQIREFYPIAEGKPFPGKDIREGFRAIDGEGGGAPTFIRTAPSLNSQNNMIVHFGTDEDHHTLVTGGVSYHEFAKFARIGPPASHFGELQADPPFGLPLLAYNDLGNEAIQPDGADGKPYIRAAGLDTYSFESLAAYDEARSIVFSYQPVVLETGNLKAGKPYAFGLTWVDDERSREQAVSIEYGGKTEQVVRSTPLPSLDRLEAPETVWFDLPAEAAAAGTVKVIVRHTAGANAVVSEALLVEGRLPAGIAGRPQKVQRPAADFARSEIYLYAADAVGKRVDPGTSYRFDKDRFYLGFTRNNPLDAADRYAQTLRTMQRIDLNPYYFPTICMWYAMEPKFGGNIALGKNDSPGAVAEMQRVAESGWLKYTTMGIRLVPDCYGRNNENGWWDDAHWQKYGSGNQVAEMTLEGAHYRLPYETTKKWCQAVIDLGGKPFTYFQTAVRSDDYAEQFPEHMLFNEPYHEIPQRDWLNHGHSSYDFTDPGFYAHMQDVYRNLHDGGMAGMMFDYPYTGWPIYGGMEDPYSTTAGAYRTVYKLSREGLGPEAYIHERNLKYGSDIALGLVSSQRTWGDTDQVTPEMVLRSGLRWYKNRVAVNYDMDAKNLLKAKPADSPDGLNKLLTMSYVTASRFLLANSFGTLAPEHVYKLSRIFPYHETPVSARPLDAFVSDYPQVYGLRIDEDWLSLTFYNEDDEQPKTVSIVLSGIEGRGGAGLDPQATYYVYDFWNDTLVGKFRGTDRLEQMLRKGEARQLAVRKVQDYPQILSTDRHLMQGWLELSDLDWNAKESTLNGIAELVEGEPMEIVLAANGSTPRSVSAATGTAELIPISGGETFRIRLTSAEGGKTDWQIAFE